ncbi:MAG TPA: ATP-binding protein [Ktedonobacteraceae bacterium]|nr:ATP-binding protein [Ktedonobacteraceae bacterium]
MDGNIHVEQHLWRQSVLTHVWSLIVGANETLPRWRSPLVGYVIGIMFVGIGLGVGLAEKQLLAFLSFPGMVLFAGVVLVALFWGVIPSILTMLLSLLTLDYLYIPPSWGFSFGSYQWNEMVQLLTFTGVCLVITFLTNQREVARLRAVAAERDAAQQARQLETIFEAISDGIVVYNKQGQVLHTNTAIQSLFGLQTIPRKEEPEIKQTLLAEAIRRGEQGQELADKRRPLARIFRGEVLTADNTPDVLAQTANGQKTVFNISGAPIRDKHGNIEQAVLIYRDVTMRRHLERRTADALQTLLEVTETLMRVPEKRTDELTDSNSYQTTDGIDAIGPQLAVLTRQVVESTHVVMYAVEQANETLYPVFSTGFSAKEEQQWRAALASNPSIGEQLGSPLLQVHLENDEVIMLDGMTLPLYTNTLPYYVETILVAPIIVDKRLAGLLCVDAGNREHSYTRKEMILVQTIARLTALAFTRVHIERERALAQANELALRETNHQIEDFLSMVCHELKTPLTIMRGSLQLAERKMHKLLSSETFSADEVCHIAPVQALLERAKQQIAIQDRLVNDLLDVTRVQTQTFSLQPEPCDLISIVKRAVNSQSEIVPERAIHLQLPEQNVLPVHVDATRITQVVNNYLTNALKYSPPDQLIKVHVSVEGELACVEVIDEGQGLSEMDSERIWERFYRVPGAVTQTSAGIAYMGLGVGLYLCKTIVERHGGQVGVRSKFGHGSTFWFTLPLDSDDDA